MLELFHKEISWDTWVRYRIIIPLSHFFTPQYNSESWIIRVLVSVSQHVTLPVFLIHWPIFHLSRKYPSSPAWLTLSQIVWEDSTVMQTRCNGWLSEVWNHQQGILSSQFLFLLTFESQVYLYMPELNCQLLQMTNVFLCQKFCMGESSES